MERERIEMGILILIVGLLMFLSVHSVRIFAPEMRTRMIDKYGENLYKGGYSVKSLIGVALIVWGYGLAREAGPPVLYAPPFWMQHVLYLLMLPVFIFFFASYLPGKIKAVLKHPQLVAVKLWAVAHLLANGDLASVLLFGSFLAWAVMSRISAKKRARAEGAMPAGDVAFGRNDIMLISVGLVLYVGFVLVGHQWVTGVAIWPPSG